MSEKIDNILGSYYCQLALNLCLQAREICIKGDCEKASKICAFVSSLCMKNNLETCKKETFLCKEFSTSCLQGRGSDSCKKAHLLCNEARRLCPKNNVVYGV